MTMLGPRIAVPEVVRVKPGALDRVAIYLDRAGLRAPLVLVSDGLREDLVRRAVEPMSARAITPRAVESVRDASFEAASALFASATATCDCVVGIGGGKALDVAKYTAFLAGRPYFAVPTSLSNDGFCSPQSSLTLAGRRRSMPAAMPYGVVVDTAVCLDAPRILWLSGVGDLVAKITAIADWKLAFHERGTPVNDFAALLSDATVFQFLAAPHFDAEGMRLLATALMLNGIAMEVCGSSRPASGSEHLISHAFDAVSARPRLHGLQVGVATYLCSLLHGRSSARIADAFTTTGFWDAIAADPIPHHEWIEACRRAPSVKENFHTVLTSRDCLPEIERHLREDPHLRRCFHGG